MANLPTPPSRLIKQRTWSPCSEREEAWLRRKDLHECRRGSPRLRRSITDEDVNEIRACIDLGFGFDLDNDGTDDAAGVRRSRRLSETFPALDLYHAVNRSYREVVSESSSSSSSSGGGGAFSAPADSPISYFSLDESTEETKARLRQWAQLVACSVRQHR